MSTPVVLWISAVWCFPCKKMSPYMETAINHFKDSVVFQKVDADADSSLAMTWNVRSVPTLIVTKDGREVGRKVGAFLSSDEIISFVQQALDE